MIIYQASKEQFLDDVLSNSIHDKVQELYYGQTGKNAADSEIRAWRESLRFMGAVMNDDEIPSDAGICIEYMLPQSSKRIDFVISGKDEESKDFAVLIELKQWDKVEPTNKDGIVITRFQYGRTETAHPSYQAWSYAALLEGFNETVYEEDIKLKPCAYMHNYIDDGEITDTFYQEYLEKAPMFFKGDDEKVKLQKFIKQFVKYGDKSKIMFRIDAGKIRPSKKIADSLAKMLKGNQEFIMIDDQKVVYETALALAQRSSKNNKSVLIVEGGPGTGKTVVAINLLSALTSKGLLTQYVSKNAAPRTVYESKLTGMFKKSEISNFFSGSGSFINVENNIFDMLLVDEAHRLNAKSGIFKNLGENQIKEIIQASRSSVFFLDEDQRVTFDDIGSKQEIKKWAMSEGAEVYELKLESQFRCNGSDGYLAWLDNMLQIRETANFNLEDTNYDFKVFDNPAELRDLIFEKDKLENVQSRMVAGYCWDWVSKKDSTSADIEFPEYYFKMKWNLQSDGNLWIINDESISEIGCIHTSQGLEVDYVGVIIGPDLIVRDGKVITVPEARARTDKSLNGYKKMLKENEKEATRRADLIIKNTYRTLMTRGMKGCYIYCTDQETGEYFKNKIAKEL